MYCSIGSWSYSGNEVKLQTERPRLDISYYKSACPLEVESHWGKVVPYTYPCCDEPYPSFDFSVVFKKRQ